jgi:hypothetical protein
MARWGLARLMPSSAMGHLQTPPTVEVHSRLTLALQTSVGRISGSTKGQKRKFAHASSS